jgi:hypothetical protein
VEATKQKEKKRKKPKPEDYTQNFCLVASIAFSCKK